MTNNDQTRSEGNTQTKYTDTEEQVRREGREEARCDSEGEEHRGAHQDGTRLTDRGRQRAHHRKDLKDKRHKRAWEKQNMTQDMIHRHK